MHAGIIEGRKAFGNVMKYLMMGTSSNFGNMFSMAGAFLFLPFLSMLPMQILLNNFLYDISQITIPTDNVDDSFTRKPRKWDISFIRTFTSEGIQQNLFHGHDDVRRQSIMQAMDSVNGRYGRGTLELAALGAEKTAPQQWKMRRENLSPEYTTKWSDVPRIG
jgi:Domain of unknown function (DUF4113)